MGDTGKDILGVFNILNASLKECRLHYWECWFEDTHTIHGLTVPALVLTAESPVMDFQSLIPGRRFTAQVLLL